jgi:hypothetical protein
MKLSTKRIIVFALAVLALIGILSTIISPEDHLFVYPAGNDYEIGKAMGSNTWTIIELVIIGYALMQIAKSKNKTPKA